MSTLQYVVEYGYEAATSTLSHLNWRSYEEYTNSGEALKAFEYYQTGVVFDEETNTRANKLWLRLSQDGMIIATQKTHTYHGNEPIITMDFKEDRVHKDMGISKPAHAVKVTGPRLTPPTQGAWVLSDYNRRTQESHVIGVTETREGMIDLLKSTLFSTDTSRKFTLEYRLFTDRKVEENNVYS